MNISTTSHLSDNCSWYSNAGDLMKIPHYTITITYFLFGLLRHTLCFLVFYPQSKKEPACVYQLFLATSQSLQIVFVVLYTATTFWFADNGDQTNSVDWYRACQVCMWYSAHLAIPLLHTFITISLFLSVSIAIDRIIALARPYKYRELAHRNHQTCALICSIILGVSTSIFDCFRSNLNKVNGRYTVELNLGFVSSSLAYSLAQLRNAVRVLGLLVLIFGNIALSRLYHQKMVKVHEIRVSSSSEKKRKDTEKSLLILIISESVFRSFGILFLSLYYFAVYAIPTFTTCQGLLYTRLLDISVQLSELLDFYIVCAFSRRFRTMMLGWARCGGG